MEIFQKSVFLYNTNSYFRAHCIPYDSENQTVKNKQFILPVMLFASSKKIKFQIHMRLVFQFSSSFLMQLYLQPAVVLYPINNNTNFNAIKIILFNYKNTYIKCGACITHCISLQECMRVSTDKLYHCILSIQHRKLLSQ